MTLDEYRHRVARYEAEVERLKRLYEQTMSGVYYDQLMEAEERLRRSRQYLKKREKQEEA